MIRMKGGERYTVQGPRYYCIPAWYSREDLLVLFRGTVATVGHGDSSLEVGLFTSNSMKAAKLCRGCRLRV
eukprot:3710336-Rhodomonas_salina.3